MYIYGKNTVTEALKNHKEVVKVYLSTHHNEILEQIKKYIDFEKVPVERISLQQMDRMFKGNHQGIAIEVKEYHYTELGELIAKNQDKKNVAFAILDGLEDPHNLGAILRTADATLLDGIIIPKNHSVSLNSTVAKVSTGAIEHILVSQVTNLVKTIETLKKQGYWIIGLDMDGLTDYKKQDYRGKIAVVIGSEGKGISRLVKENCDFLVHIPMLGHVNSLNASVSASIIFYEIIRNRLDE